MTFFLKLPTQCPGEGGQHENCGGPAGEGADRGGQQGGRAQGILFSLVLPHPHLTEVSKL